MDNGTIVEELNTLLRGTFMGIRSLEHYIKKVDDPELKKHFQVMQQDTKINAQKIAERIQNLNGVPADSEGVSGSLHSLMHKMTLPNNPIEIIQDAIKGIGQYGIAYSEEVVRGDLDSESRKIIEEVLDTNRRHYDQLNQLLH